MINQLKYKIIFFLVLSLCSSMTSSLYSSQQKFLKKLHYSNTEGEKGLTTFFYDTKGKNFRSIWILENDSRSSMNFHEFDSMGNLIKKYREFSDKLTSETIYKYNGTRLISEAFSSSDGKKGNTEYTYDSQGRKKKAECKGLNGWFHGTITYNYKESEHPVKAEIRKDNRPVGSITYTYLNGKLQKEIWTMGSWKQQFVYEYKTLQKNPVSLTWATPYIKSSPGIQVTGENYTFNGEVGGPSVYKYRKGILNKKYFNRSDKVKTETTYIYDRAGILLESRRKYSDGKSAKFFYIFNDKKQLTHRYFFGSDGLKGFERYYYIEGALTSAKLENFDSWLSGTITFTPGPGGLPLKGHLIGRNFTGDLIFTYDKNRMLKVLRWNFSVGKYQEYKFTYKQQ